MKISVCMATYNGEKYIKEQLESILIQLSDNDEVIISDDSSSDSTLEIIQSFNDDRIKLFCDKIFHSPIFNFENALQHVTGDVIALSDQDDIWKNNKIEIVKKSFENSKETIALRMYNGQCIDKTGKVIYKNLYEYLNIHEGLIQNIIKNSFIGCNIAFTKPLLDIVLPFPKNTPMHDMWLGNNAYIYGNVEFVDKKVFNYRIHDNNYSIKDNSFFQKIIWRVELITNLIKRYTYVKFRT